MNYYFCIPTKDVTMQMVNCSTSYSRDEMRKILIKGLFFNTEHCVFKVEERIFDEVTYFDHLQARNNEDMRQFLIENAIQDPINE